MNAQNTVNDSNSNDSNSSELYLLKLINYSYCYQPTRTAHSGQVDEFRNPMKNELKTTRV